MWSQLLNNYLGPASVVITLLTFIPILATFYKITFGEEKRRRRWFKETSQQKGQRPSILIIEINRNISSHVEKYRQDQEDLANIPKDRIFKVSAKQVLNKDGLEAHDIPKLVKAIQKESKAIEDAATDVLHLFYAGPVAIAPLIGVEFVNGCRVLLYHFNTDSSSYENWGPLRHRHS